MAVNFGYEVLASVCVCVCMCMCVRYCVCVHVHAFLLEFFLSIRCLHVPV